MRVEKSRDHLTAFIRIKPVRTGMFRLRFVRIIGREVLFGEREGNTEGIIISTIFFVVIN